VPYRFDDNNSTFPMSIMEEARKYRARNQVAIESYQQLLEFLDGGFGFVIIGVLLSSRFGLCRGRLTRYDVQEDGRRGGHAMAFVGFKPDGRLRLVNSWPDWGDSLGCADVDPEAVDYWLSRPYTVMRGITDLTGFDRVRVLRQSKGMG
jgi:hypothetical protein